MFLSKKPHKEGRKQEPATPETERFWGEFNFTRVETKAMLDKNQLFFDC